MLVPYQNTYWVKENALLAGCYPGAPSSDLIPARLAALVDSKVNVVINLLEASETYSDGSSYVPYDEDFLRLAHTQGLAAKCYNFPIKDFGLPDTRQMLHILNEIDANLAQERRVFVHCWGGKGRTGTVVGCWLARHGDLSPLDTLQALRKDCPNAKQPSPETEEQCLFVSNWNKGV